jgi:isopenicillin N synthase-like dioxygenase
MSALGYAHQVGVLETFQLKLNDDPEFKWPTTEGFKEKVVSYYRLLDNTARLILRCIAGAYSSDQDDTSGAFEESTFLNFTARPDVAVRRILRPNVGQNVHYAR